MFRRKMATKLLNMGVESLHTVTYQSLLLKESLIDFEFVIQDEKLVVHGPICIKQRLGKLTWMNTKTHR